MSGAKEEKRASHTPTPWKAEPVNLDNPNGFPFWHIVRDDGNRHPDSILQIFWHDGIQPQDEANAQFIVRAVNSHEAMVEACEAALLEFEGLYQVALLNPANRGMKEAAIIGTLRSALAKAKEEVSQ